MANWKQTKTTPNWKNLKTMPSAMMTAIW